MFYRPYTAIQSLTMIFHGLFSKRRANGRFMSHSGVISLSASDPTPRTPARLAFIPNHVACVAVALTDILAVASRVTWPILANQGGRGGTNLQDSDFEKSKFRLGKTIGKPLTKLLHWGFARRTYCWLDGACSSSLPKVNGDRNVVLKCYELPHIWSVLRQLLIGT